MAGPRAPDGMLQLTHAHGCAQGLPALAEPLASSSCFLSSSSFHSTQGRVSRGEERFAYATTRPPYSYP